MTIGWDLRRISSKIWAWILRPINSLSFSSWRKIPGKFCKKVNFFHEFNPETLDARNSGTMASCAAWRRPWKRRTDINWAGSQEIRLNSVIISYTGIPLLYSGDDKIGTIWTWWDYKKDNTIAHQLIFPDAALCTGWIDKAADRHNMNKRAGRYLLAVSEMIRVRRKDKRIFALDIPSIPVDTGKHGLLLHFTGGQDAGACKLAKRSGRPWTAMLWTAGLPWELHDLI